MREQLRHVREMADEHDITRFGGDRVDDPGGRVRGLEAARGGEGRERIAAPPEGFGGLPGPEFSAMPDDGGFHAARRRLLCQEIDLDAAACGKRPRRVDVWSYRIAVMNEIQLYFDTILRPVAATSMLLTPLTSVTSPVSVMVCDMCGTSLAFMFAATSPVTV
jgi:hypothetical protein